MDDGYKHFRYIALLHDKLVLASFFLASVFTS